MKGLILKDLYCVRSMVLLASGIMLPLFVMMFLMNGELTDPALLQDNPFAPVFSCIGFILIDVIVILLFSSFTLNTLAEDNASGWSTLQLAMPVTTRQIVNGKLISSVALVGIFTAACLIVNVIGGLLYGGTMELLLAAPPVLGCVELCALFPTFPVALKVSSGAASLIYAAFMLVMIASVAVPLWFCMESNLPIWALRVIFYGALPVLTAALGFISQRVSMSRLKAE